MVKLVVMYKKPADVEAFEKHYRETHLPLARKMPGVRRLDVSHFTGSPVGEPKYYMMAEVFFDDKASMMAALGSPEGKAAGKDIMTAAGDILHMMFADVTDATK